MLQIKTNKLFANNYFKHVFQIIKSVSLLSSNEYAMSKESMRDNRDIIAKQIMSTNDDISSFVRFNRHITRPKPQQFTELLHSNSDESLQLKIELICAEFEYILETTGTVPSDGITTERMKQLLSSSAQLRQKLFQKWYLNGSHSLRKCLNKAIPNLVSDDNNDTNSDNQINANSNQIGIFGQNGNLNYGLNGNTILGRIGIKKTRRKIRQRYRVSTQLGQHLVIDLNSDYEPFISKKKHRFGLTNIVRVYGNNLKHYTYPYDLHFCNMNTSSVTYQDLTKLIGKPVIDLMVNITNKSYLDIFECKQNMIFVTSHADEELTDYDHSAIYIMNPFVEIQSDSQRIKQFLDNKFASEGIRSARLPLDRYVRLKYPSSIYIQNYINILNDVKMGKHWKTAILDNVSIKLIMTEIDLFYEKAMKFLEQ